MGDRLQATFGFGGGASGYFNSVKNSDGDRGQWVSYFSLTVLAMMQGFIYSGLMSFLPRYLSQWQLSGGDAGWEGSGKVLAAGVLLLGCIGQYLAGRFARTDLLERQLTAA